MCCLCLLFGVFKSLFLFVTASSRRIFGLEMCVCSVPEGQLTYWGREKYASNSSELLRLRTTSAFVPAETMGFVDKLFECLTTKNYLGIPAVKEPPKEEVKPAAVKSDVVEVRACKTNSSGIKQFPCKNHSIKGFCGQIMGILIPNHSPQTKKLLCIASASSSNVVSSEGWSSRGGERKQA